MGRRLLFIILCSFLIISLLSTSIAINDECEADQTKYYRDFDVDNYGNAASSKCDITMPEGYVTDNTDCDDSNANVHPGAIEVCTDGKDNDCDGYTDYEDTDCMQASKYKNVTLTNGNFVTEVRGINIYLGRIIGSGSSITVEAINSTHTIEKTIQKEELALECTNKKCDKFITFELDNPLIVQPNKFYSLIIFSDGNKDNTLTIGQHYPGPASYYRNSETESWQKENTPYMVMLETYEVIN